MNIENLFKKCAVLFFIIFLGGCSASVQLRNPSGGNSKPGAIALSTFMLTGDVNNRDNDRYYYVFDVKLAEEVSPGKFVEVEFPKAEKSSFFGPYVNDHVVLKNTGHVITGLNPNKTYILTYGKTAFIHYRTQYTIGMSVDPNKSKNVLVIRPEPGKIKYYGIYAFVRNSDWKVNEGEENDFDEEEIFLHKGDEILKKTKVDTSILPYTYGLWGERTEKGAEKYLLKEFISSQSDDYWVDLAKNRLKEID